MGQIVSECCDEGGTSKNEQAKEFVYHKRSKQGSSAQGYSISILKKDATTRAQALLRVMHDEGIIVIHTLENGVTKLAHVKIDDLVTCSPDCLQRLHDIVDENEMRNCLVLRVDPHAIDRSVQGNKGTPQDKSTLEQEAASKNRPGIPMFFDDIDEMRAFKNEITRYKEARRKG